MSLPSLMVAPNGATKSKRDHPALPLTLAEVTTTARACVAAGADGLHLHLRDIEGGHLLDSGAYREALEHLATELPGLPVQITTEAGGRYDPGHQKYVALHSGATLVSAAYREITRDEGAPSFYAYAAERGIAVQHILYDVADAEGLARTLPDPLLRDPALQLIFVLGRYVDGQVSKPAMLKPFLDWMKREGLEPDWMLCAFGQGETDCLRAAHKAGGKCRVGFENSLVNKDGTVAQDNAERVAEVASVLR